MLPSSRLLLALAQQPVPAAPASPTPPPSTATRTRPERDTLRLFAVGDLNLGWDVATDYLLKGDLRYPFDSVRDTLAAADILFGNLESPIAPVGQPFVHTGSPVFSAPPMAADALVRAGFDVVS